MAGNSVQFVNQAHLHFGQKRTTGGINVWLCQSADNPAPAAVADPKATPFCPSPSGTVTGTIRPDQVLPLSGQGLPADQDGFDALSKRCKTTPSTAMSTSTGSPRVRFAGSLAITATTSSLG
jgi:hypothetical protein